MPHRGVSHSRVRMGSVDRRGFLRRITAVSAATAGSGILAGTLLGASTSFSEAETEAPPAWKRAPCRLCGVGCGLLVGVESRRAGAVKGDPESPVGSGLACAKGYHSVQALYGRDRITRAMVRRNGGLTPVPLGDALDIVAHRLRDTIARHGKDSVAMYGSAQWSITDAYVASKFFKGGIGTNNIESSSRLYAAAASAGLESSFGLDGSLGCYEDVDQADLFILWDINLAETDPVLFSRMLDRRRRDRAVRIVDVTTRTTRTSYAADRALLHAPQSGLFLANAIAHEIVAHKWFNRRFLERHVAFKRGKTGIGHGLDSDDLVVDDAIGATWKEYEEFLASYSSERAQQLSGLAADDIRWLAAQYGSPARKVMTVWGAETNQHSRGTWMNNLLYNIHLLVGKIGSPGNSALSITGQPSGGNSIHDAGSLTHTLPRGVVSSEQDRRRVADIWRVPAANINPRASRTVVPMFRALERGDVRFLWVQATNPMTSLPNLQRFRRAARKDDAFLVVSEVYPTSTTDVADVVLPAAMWLEREGIYGNVERRAQYFEDVVPPPGDAMGDAWQMIEVARRMGMGALFPWDRERHVEKSWEEYRRFHSDSRSALPSIAELRARPGVIWPFVKGRETKWRYNPAYDPAANPEHGPFDFYGHSDHRAWVWLRPHEPPAESPSSTYPFRLTIGAVLEHTGAGAMTRRIPILHDSVPKSYVEVHRDDATRLGIRNRDMVRLVSARGSLEIEARIDYRSRPQRGQLFVPFFDEGHPIRALMLDAFCPLSGQPDTAAFAVRLERAAARKDRDPT
jgi:nitrate reductase (cytochrome)